MDKLANLRNRHLNCTALILGGGPSLVSDIQRAPQNALKIAVNEHAFFAGIAQPDYLVFMDEPEQNPRLMEAVQASGGVKVSPQARYTEIDLRGMPEFYYRGSGVVAAWFAVHLGCAPVYLCGMDLYQGEQKYVHGDAGYEDRDVYEIPLAEHLKRWQGLRKYKNIRAMSGPLTEIFGHMM